MSRIFKGASIQNKEREEDSDGTSSTDWEKVSLPVGEVTPWVFVFFNQRYNQRICILCILKRKEAEFGFYIYFFHVSHVNIFLKNQQKPLWIPAIAQSHTALATVASPLESPNIKTENFKCTSRDFPGSPVIKTLCFHYRGHGFHP